MLNTQMTRQSAKDTRNYKVKQGVNKKKQTKNNIIKDKAEKKIFIVTTSSKRVRWIGGKVTITIQYGKKYLVQNKEKVLMC